MSEGDIARLEQRIIKLEKQVKQLTAKVETALKAGKSAKRVAKKIQ